MILGLSTSDFDFNLIAGKLTFIVRTSGLSLSPRCSMQKNNTNHYLKMLQKLIKDYTKGRGIKIYFFGSRARGKEHKLSDIDIAILPLEPLPAGFMANLKEKIEESTIPYSVDVVDLSQVDAKFREKILTEAIEWKD